MTDEQLAEIEARCEAVCNKTAGENYGTEAWLTFCAHAKRDIPALLAEIYRLRIEIFRNRGREEADKVLVMAALNRYSVGTQTWDDIAWQIGLIIDEKERLQAEVTALKDENEQLLYVLKKNHITVYNTAEDVENAMYE